MIIRPDQDAIGNAIADYYAGVQYAAVAVFSTVDDNYFLESKELFRDFSEMSDIDKKALDLCHGSVLDIGAGAGSHSLVLQKKLHVTALEISPKACEIISKRGVQKVINQDYFEYQTKDKYDVLLLMMNGIGFVGSLNGFRDFLAHSYTILADDGKIVFDSTFLSDDHKLWCDQNDHNYGQVDYQMIYNEFATDSFNWLYVDFDVIKKIALEHNFESVLEYRNDKDEYVASLRKC